MALLVPEDVNESALPEETSNEETVLDDMSGDEESLVVTDDTESDEADLGLILQEEIVEEAETAAVAEEIDLPEVEAAGDLLGDGCRRQRFCSRYGDGRGQYP